MQPGRAYKVSDSKSAMSMITSEQSNTYVIKNPQTPRGIRVLIVITIQIGASLVPNPTICMIAERLSQIHIQCSH